MKKLTIICLLALAYTSTNAQEPTKQEAMDFIAKKIKQHINQDKDFLSFSNGIVTIKKVERGNAITDLINLNNVTKYFSGTIYGPRVFYGVTNNPLINTQYKDYENNVELYYYVRMANEEGLEERIKKAFNVIIKSNTEDPNSKF